ncbi:MAG TPA: lasso peptide biosynthesis B2 protein [Polyangiaceae bacterium]|nr:lasso peptide biosynthesis B2 protein [Polyangiaceae bacterium]
MRATDVSRFWHAERAEQLRWVSTLGAVAAVRVGLHICSLRQLATIMGLSVGDAAVAQSLCTQAEALAVARCVRGVLARWPSQSECLVGALAAGCLLRRQRPQLLIGVRGRAPQIAAHAWLEVNGARLHITDADVNADFVALRRARAA